MIDRGEKMRIEQISTEQYADFINDRNIPYGFLQMPSYASIQDRFVLADADRQHAVIIEPKPAMKLWKYAYTAGGVLSTDPDSDGEFLQEVSAWLKKNGYILWRIESDVETKEYDKYGAEVENGFDNTKTYLKLMTDQGFVWHDLGKGYNTNYQVTWKSVVELKPDAVHSRKGYLGQSAASGNLTIEDVLATMGSSSRKYMRKAARDGFVLEVKKPSEMSEEDWKELEKMIETSGDFQGFKSEDGGRRIQLAEASEDNCYLVFLRNREKETVYAGYWYYTNCEMLCYLGGMDRSKTKYNIASFIHTEMYKRALDMGLEQYNYGGVSGYFNKDEEGYGCYQFKRELGAKVAHTFGVFDKALTGPGTLFEKRLTKHM